MKKEYTKPSMKAHKIQPVSIICGSGGERSTLSEGDYGDKPQVEEHTYSTTTYNGIWGE